MKSDKTGKPGMVTVLSAVATPWLTAELMRTAFEAAYATHCGLLEAPRRVQELLEAKAMQAQSPMGARFCAVYTATVKAQRPVEALDPCELTCVATSARREAFMQTMREPVWSALKSFHQACEAVRGTDLKKNSLPFLEHSKAQEVLEAFALALQGFGASTAKTVVREAIRVRDLLEHPDLPAVLDLENRTAVVMALKLRKSPSETNFLDEMKALLGEIHSFAKGDTANASAFAACCRQDSRLDWRHFG